MREEITMAEIKAFVGRVSAPAHGEWFDFPVSEEEVRKVLGISEEEDVELMISDYEAPVKISEYSSIRELNELVEKLDELPKDIEEHAGEIMDYFDISLDELLDHKEDIIFYPEVYTNKDLGEYIVDNIYGSVNSLPKEQIELYFDFDSFGRDVRLGNSVAFLDGGAFELNW